MPVLITRLADAGDVGVGVGFVSEEVAASFSCIVMLARALPLPPSARPAMKSHRDAIVPEYPPPPRANKLDDHPLNCQSPTSCAR
eukprot:2136178-Pleurochrysis_carterae.AAC.1